MTLPSYDTASLTDESIQPIRKDFRTCDGVQIIQMHIPRKGTIVPQHSHSYPHTSMLATGRVRAFKDGELIGEFQSPQIIFIEEHCKHAFISLEDNTIIYCIHNLHGKDEIEIHAEHYLTGE